MDQPEPGSFLPEPEYGVIADFRYQIRRFLRFMDEHIRDAGLQPQEYFLLLALKGRAWGKDPDVVAIGEHLQVNDTAVRALLSSCETQGLLTPAGNGNTICLTPKGLALVRRLASIAQQELGRRAPEIAGLISSLDQKKADFPENAVNLPPAPSPDQSKKYMGPRCRARLKHS